MYKVHAIFLFISLPSSLVMLRSAHLVYLGDGNQTNLILIPHLYKDDTIKKCGVDMFKKEDKSKIKRKCRCIEATKRICSICDSLSLLNQMNQTNIQAMIIRSIQIEMFRSIPGKSNKLHIYNKIRKSMCTFMYL